MNQIINDDIELIEPGHKYVLKSDPEFGFTSCTSFIDYFFRPFDKIAIADKLTASHPAYQGISPEELIAQWDQTAVDGTNVHKEIQDYINTGALPKLRKSIKAVEHLRKQDFNSIEIMPEVRVFSKDLGLAGTIDLLVYDKKTQFYHILDWKTNKKMDMSSYGNKMGNHYATSKIMDCNYYHYSLQLSLYRYILEKEYGLEIFSCGIYHLTDEKLVPIKCGYHKNIIEEMLKADKDALCKKRQDSLTKPAN